MAPTRTRWRLLLVIAVVTLAGSAIGVHRHDFISSTQPSPRRSGGGGVIGTLRATTSTGRQGAYFLPPGYESRVLPLLVFLHGFGGRGAGVIVRLRMLAEREQFTFARGIVLVRPTRAVSSAAASECAGGLAPLRRSTAERST